MERCQELSQEACQGKLETAMLMDKNKRIAMEMIDVEARMQAAEDRVRQVEAANKQLVADNVELLKAKEKSSVLIQNQDNKLKELEAARTGLTKQVKGLKTTVSEKEAKILDLEATKVAQAIKQQKTETLLAARETEITQLKDLINNLQAGMKSSEDGAAVMKELQDSVEALKKEAENKNKEMEAQLLVVASRAVADFRASPEFRAEMVDFSLKAYERGADMIQGKISAKYPDLDLGFLDDDDED